MKTNLWKLIVGLGVAAVVLGATLPDPYTSYNDNLVVRTNATVRNALKFGTSTNEWSTSSGTNLTVSGATYPSFVQATNTLGVTTTGLALMQAADKAAGRAAIDAYSSYGGAITGNVSFAGTTNRFTLPNLTTAQKNALTPGSGDMVFDSDLGRFQAYDGAAWHSRVRLDGDTMSGALASPAFDYTAPATLTPIDAGTSIDFTAANRTASCTLTGQVTFAYAGISGTAIKTYNIQVQNAQATNCPFTFPAGTRIMGIAGYQTAGKGGRLTFEYWPSVSTNVFYVESQ